MSFLTLNGNWNMGICDDSQYITTSRNFKTISDVKVNDIKIIPATVPGNFEIDLEKANLIPDLFFGKNLEIAQKLEMCHLFYSKEFEIKNINTPLYINFDGIDTFSDIYINGEYVGSTDNMLISHKISGEKLVVGYNELFIHITPATLKAREYENPMYTFGLKYNFDMMNIRKSNYMAGWDIFPRMMSGGIWRGVSIESEKSLKFLQTYVYVRHLPKDHSTVDMEFFYEVDFARSPYADFAIEYTMEINGITHTASSRAWAKAGRIIMSFENPELWWPKGQGKQNLYTVNVRLLDKGVCIDEKMFKTGIRVVELDRTSVTNKNGDGEFCFIINHRKIFVLGTNWVPLDSLPSRSSAKLEKALDFVDDIGCNMIRAWGGGYYEEDCFFEICDEKGFMVWQDFMLGCGMYPQTEPFLSQLRTELEFIIKKFRQHPSLCLWAGDNECDCATSWAGGFIDPNDNVITRKLMPEVIRQHDFVRPFLPSSPYMDKKSVELGIDLITEDHLWGPRDYFKSDFYRNALAHFASETGYHGCNSVESIRKFISENSLWPYNNPEWKLHASSPVADEDSPYIYRIELMAQQIRVLFGNIPNNLEEFSLLSQISQGEAKKFFIERFRIGKWRRTGIIWWNILDGCPQFSDAVVDYYFNKKLAYDYIKTSQQPICLMADDAKDRKLIIMAANDTVEDVPIDFAVKILSNEKILFTGKSILLANTTSQLCEVANVPNGEFLLMEWASANYSGNNHYAVGDVPYDKKIYIKNATKLGYI